MGWSIWDDLFRLLAGADCQPEASWGLLIELGWNLVFFFVASCTMAFQKQHATWPGSARLLRSASEVRWFCKSQHWSSLIRGKDITVLFGMRRKAKEKQLCLFMTTWGHTAVLSQERLLILGKVPQDSFPAVLQSRQENGGKSPNFRMKHFFLSTWASSSGKIVTWCSKVNLTSELCFLIREKWIRMWSFGLLWHADMQISVGNHLIEVVVGVNSQWL